MAWGCATETSDVQTMHAQIPHGLNDVALPIQKSGFFLRAPWKAL